MLAVVTLEGALVRLEPLAQEHVPALVRAAADGREAFSLTDVPADEPSMQRYVDRALQGRASQTMLPFAIVDRRRGKVVGSTRFGYIEFWNWAPGSPHQRGEHLPDVAEIGWTWLSSEARGTGINGEMKLLMLTHAFETWRVHRISLRTDARNTLSRRAIERVGARFDGILRAAKVGYDGAIRDTATYSIVDSEWPAVKARLISRVTLAR